MENCIARAEHEEFAKRIDAENTRIAMSAVVPEGSEFTDKLDITDAVAEAASAQGGKISELYGVTNGGADAGYVMKISASGSQGTIVMMVGVDANKAITGISVVSHAETSGIGTKVVDNEPNSAGVPVLDQFVGLSGAGTLNVGSTITAISGATGSKYSLVPTDNSAGNFVKIQQRIPVRIDFTHLSKEENGKLAAGMMVIVKAKL